MERERGGRERVGEIHEESERHWETQRVRESVWSQNQLLLKSFPICVKERAAPTSACIKSEHWRGGKLQTDSHRTEGRRSWERQSHKSGRVVLLPHSVCCLYIGLLIGAHCDGPVWASPQTLPDWYITYSSNVTSWQPFWKKYYSLWAWARLHAWESGWRYWKRGERDVGRKKNWVCWFLPLL